ncbi:MAG: hypothetical protein LUG18_01375 [Candidatus Azobacteroides sp.]|nr:hypothetical protein [Candidatus Azobacteroides sp.]
MEATVQGIFTSGYLPSSIGDYFELYEIIEPDVDNLPGCNYKWALEKFKTVAYSLEPSLFDLEKARDYFGSTVYEEKNPVRLIFSYLGLAICSYYLNKKEHVPAYLKKALSVPLPEPGFLSGWGKAESKKNNFLHALSPRLGILAETSAYSDEKRERKLYDLRKQIADCLESM